MHSIVVIGAGQAAASLVETLRLEGFGGAITVVGDEPAPPYQRPPLSKKYLLGEMTADRLWLKPEGFWTDNAVTLITGTAATSIDRAAQRVILADGRALHWDGLALVTGALPRRLPATIGGDLAGVHVVRTLADVDALAPAVQPGARLAVIGGGYIGLEAAAVAAQRGMAVTLIEAAPRILGRVAAPETAAFFRDLHTRHGVDVREGTAVAALEGDKGRLTAIRLADGTRIPADVAVVGIGVTPNTALAEAAGLTLDNGIATDTACRTSDPAIVAAGDAASFPWRGNRIRLESVPNAIDMGRAAARSLLGQPVTYDPVPWFWSDQYDVKLQIAGLNAGYDRVVSRPGSRPGTLSIWYFRGPTLLAVDAMGDARAYMTGKRWLEAAYSPDAGALADPAADLKTLG